MDDEQAELLCDAMAEFLFGLWQKQHKQRTAAVAATSADAPALATEGNQSGEQEPQNGQRVYG